MTDQIAIEVDATGNALAMMRIFHVRTPDGTVVFEPSYAATVTRMEVESATPLGMPTVRCAALTGGTCETRFHPGSEFVTGTDRSP